MTTNVARISYYVVVLQRSDTASRFEPHTVSGSVIKMETALNIFVYHYISWCYSGQDSN